MAEKRWYKPVFFTFVLLGLLLLVIGATYTESGANELDYGQRGEFFVTDFEEGLTIIVVAEEVEANCEGFEFLLEDELYNPVPVEKTSCEDWASSSTYQFRIHNLSTGRYNYEATDWVSIMAVEGDVDAFMEDYAFGNSIADVGAGFCCLGMIAHVVIGRGIAKASKAEHQVVLDDAQRTVVEIQPPVHETVGGEEFSWPVSEEATTVEEPPSGSFWENMLKD